MRLTNRTALTVSALSVSSMALLAGCSAGTPDGGGSGPAVAAASPDLEAGARIDGVQTFPYVRPHHEAKRYDYPQAPPVGGDHWPFMVGDVKGWLACGVYDRRVPDEFAVHSMEHGAVWLTYRPGTPAAQVARLAALADRQPDYVIVSPYDGQPGAFMASTWDAQLSADAPDDPRLAAFVEAYAGGNQGKEKGARCAGGSTPGQADAALAATDAQSG